MDKILKGKVFLFGDNIDTDQIYPGRFVQYTDIEDVAKYAMAGADGDFTKKVKAGDIIIGGTNFGCGSSREHAAITLKAVGLGCVIAESYSRIFFRNAINLGLPLITCEGISGLVKEGNVITVDIEEGIIRRGSEEIASITPFSEYISNILESGGIKPLVRKQLTGS